MLQVKIEKTLILSVVALGVSCIITQIILLREFLSVFYGNELVIGIILGNWMILTGIGSLIGKIAEKTKKNITLNFLLVLLAIIPFTTVFLLDYLRNIVFPVGIMIDILQIFYSSFILLIPFCIVSGFLFTLLSHLISERYNANLIGTVYALESIGSIIGGILISFVMIYLLTTFQSLLVLMIFNLAVAILLSIKFEKKILRNITLCLLISPLILFVLNFDKLTREFLYPNQVLLFYKDTPYGNITITAQGEQKNFFENSYLMFSTHDVTMNEEAVHYAMIQHPNPKKVLLISGGISGTPQEILKYDVERIDYVEINPWLIQIGEKYTTALKDEKINLIVEDARLYVKRTDEQYDVALINLPDPGTAQLNRFYTDEFFKELKSKLDENAIVSISVTSSADYLSREAREVKSVIYNTLKSNFHNVLIVPGLKDYLVASDESLNIEITQMIEQKEIDNVYVNRYYIDDDILKQRSSFILSNLDRNTDLNKDFTPISYYRQLIYWLSYFEIDYRLLIFAGIAILILLIKLLNPISFGMFAGGFAASSLEILLLIAFQIIYGYVYQMVGIIITVFMAGLAFGALFRHKIITRVDILNYVKIQFVIGIYSILIPFILLILKFAALNIVLIHILFFLFTFAIAVFVGMEFSLASKIRSGTVSSIASEIYSIDLIGSAIGALAVTVFLIPLIGIVNTGLVIGGLNFLSGTISFVNRKKYLLS